jgi:5-formaminoimidazole-4-carboxamide-1-(beta)-D-ribofuranosyl 5'-monophosphate synthetase
LDGYDLENLSIGSVGSHSDLDVGLGAIEEGFRNFTIAKEEREAPYTGSFKERKQGNRTVGCIQKYKIVDNWLDVASSEVADWVRNQNGIGILNRAWAVYMRDKKGTPENAYDAIKSINIPFLGNIEILQAEERDPRFRVEYNQDFLLEKAGIPTPRKIDSPEEIRDWVMVKAAMFGSDRDFARDFRVVKDYEDYKVKVEEAVSRAPDNKKEMVREAFQNALIVEYIPETTGPINLNFFYSPTWDDLELLGTDSRTQFLNGEERTHYPISLRESLYQQADELGRAFLKTVKTYYPGGIGMCFAIQCMGDKEEEKLLAIDTCCSRPAGSPDVYNTPPSDYTHGMPVSYGRRIAMEVRDALEQNQTIDYLVS